MSRTRIQRVAFRTSHQQHVFASRMLHKVVIRPRTMIVPIFAHLRRVQEDNSPSFKPYLCILGAWMPALRSRDSSKLVGTWLPDLMDCI